MAVAYALCVIGPSVALAFADSQTLMGHCLTDAADGAPRLHVHSDGAHKGAELGTLAKGAGTQDNDLSPCCDLSCEVTSQNDFAVRVEPPFGASIVVSPLARPLNGRRPGPPNRPPSVTLPSL